MQQQISVITLGIDDLVRSKRFYGEGFGWTPIFENEEITFYQMNGLVLGTWKKAVLCNDMQRPAASDPSASFSLAHNVNAREHVVPLIERLITVGGVFSGRRTNLRMAASEAMLPIPMAMPGKSPGIPSGPSTRMAMLASRHSQSDSEALRDRQQSARSWSIVAIAESIGERQIPTRSGPSS